MTYEEGVFLLSPLARTTLAGFYHLFLVKHSCQDLSKVNTAEKGILVSCGQHFERQPSATTCPLSHTSLPTQHRLEDRPTLPPAAEDGLPFVI